MKYVIFATFLNSKKESAVSKYAFPNEDDDQEDAMNIPKQSQYGASSSSSHQTVSYPTSKYESSKQQMPSHPPPPGPSVLDKFGNSPRS